MASTSGNWFENILTTVASTWDKNQDRELQREIARQEAEANAWWKFWDGEAGTPTNPGMGTNRKKGKPTDWQAVMAMVAVGSLILTAFGLFMRQKRKR